MGTIAEFNRVLEGARQQRAERVGSSLKSPALYIAVTIALSLALSQALYEPSTHAAIAAQAPPPISLSV
jgi:hypothetical protein